jgi:hypothetical protein
MAGQLEQRLFLFLLWLGAPNRDLLRRIAGTDQPLTLARLGRRRLALLTPC